MEGSGGEFKPQTCCPVSGVWDCEQASAYFGQGCRLVQSFCRQGKLCRRRLERRVLIS